MSKMWSFLFDVLTDECELPVNPITARIIMGVIALIAFLSAYIVVGIGYKDGSIQGKGEGSATHWTVRIIVFFILWTSANVIFRIYNQVGSLRNTILLIGGCIVLFIIVCIGISHVIKNKVEKRGS